MKNKGQRSRPAPISDAAVRAKTGKAWQEWFALLDAAGAPKMSHAQMARYLHEEQGVPGWWSQMVAVGYEQARGLREKHQVAGGYQISVSKTLDVPVADAYRAWADEEARSRWLPTAAATIRKATPDRSIRATWSADHTSLDVNFYRKGASKSQVVVQHSKLKDASEAEGMKSFWKDVLARLRAFLSDCESI